MREHVRILVQRAQVKSRHRKAPPEDGGHEANGSETADGGEGHAVQIDGVEKWRAGVLWHDVS